MDQIAPQTNSHDPSLEVIKVLDFLERDILINGWGENNEQIPPPPPRFIKFYSLSIC